MNTNTTEILAGEQTRTTYGVWGFTYGFLGGVWTIEEAKALIAETRVRLPEIKLYDVHRCQPGFYFQNHRVYSEGYPLNQQDFPLVNRDSPTEDHFQYAVRMAAADRSGQNIPEQDGNRGDKDLGGEYR